MPEAIFHDHAPRDIDLWCFYYQPLLELSPATVAAYETLLTPAEIARYLAYVFDKDRLIFLATRAAVRTVLSHYVTRPPQGVALQNRTERQACAGRHAGVRSLWSCPNSPDGLQFSTDVKRFNDIGIDFLRIQTPFKCIG